MSQQVSLRERKKLRTRQVIARAALGLFAERGFDHVTVSEVADAADVSRKTVFNYFPAKDDLVLGDLENYEGAMLKAVRERQSGESAVAAFGRFVLEPNPLDPGENAAQDLITVSRTIADSPVLQAHEERILTRCTASMAALLGEETAAGEGQVEPWIAAIAMMGVYRTLIVHVQGRPEAPHLASEARAQGARALMLLEDGLDCYAVKAFAQPRSSARR